MLPKAELHCHIEGAAPPALALRQADKYGVDISARVRDGRFVWNGFVDFLACYDLVASLFRSPEDYARLAEDYLSSLARDGAIYAEFFTSPDHALKAGLSPAGYTEGLAEGIRRANAKTGIEARMIVTGVRHFGVESVVAAARFAATCREPLVTGFGMAGDESAGDMEDFVRAFGNAREAGLGITVHAGEIEGWASVEAALDHIRPSRIGHGVRAIESPALVERLAAEGTVLEVCPGSNISVGVFADYAAHPLRRLRDAGCRVTVSSDDPPYFDTTLAREYETAKREFGFDDQQLLALTRTAIAAAFVDRKTRATLMEKVEAAASRLAQGERRNA